MSGAFMNGLKEMQALDKSLESIFEEQPAIQSRAAFEINEFDMDSQALMFQKNPKLSDMKHYEKVERDKLQKHFLHLEYDQRLICSCAKKQNLGSNQFCQKHQGIKQLMITHTYLNYNGTQEYEIEDVIDLLKEQMEQFKTISDPYLQKDLEFLDKSIYTLYISRTDTFREKIVRAYQEKERELFEAKTKLMKFELDMKSTAEFKAKYESLQKENEMLKNKLFSSEQVNLNKTCNLEDEIGEFKQRFEIDSKYLEDLRNQNQSLIDEIGNCKDLISNLRNQKQQAFDKLAKLQKKFELLSNENHMFRKFYQKNFKKQDFYEKEIDEIFADFNKGLNQKNHFITKNMDALETTVDSFTFCKSKVLRDFINKDL